MIRTVHRDDDATTVDKVARNILSLFERERERDDRQEGRPVVRSLARTEKTKEATDESFCLPRDGFYGPEERARCARQEKGTSSKRPVSIKRR